MRGLKDWIVERALPLWSHAGFDPRHGRFQERLSLSGKPVEVPHRAMVQARQIYVHAHAAHLGWLPEGGALAEVAMASLIRDFCIRSNHQASFAFSVDSGGTVVSKTRDAYSHAFILFALAWTYRLNGDPALLTLADDVIAFMDQHLRDPRHGGLFDRHPVLERSKKQNPLMHLLEAYLALDDVAPGCGYLERAKELVSVFKQRLFDEKAGVLLEHFAEDWSAHPEWSKRSLFEPGHHFEWVWLLSAYQQRTGEDLGPWIGTLDDVGHRHGVSDRGLIFDELDADRRVLKSSHRIWPHTEAMRAAAARHSAGHPGAKALASTMGRVLRDNFLDRPVAGGWTDRISASGEALSDDMPASSLYHLFLAAAEVDRVFGATDAI